MANFSIVNSKITVWNVFDSPPLATNLKKMFVIDKKIALA